jgi:hypothetical protein
VYCTGLSVAPVLPVVFSLTGSAEPAHSDTAVARVAAIGYAGLLVAPLAVWSLGGVDDSAHTAVAVLTASVGGLITAAAWLRPGSAGWSMAGRAASGGVRVVRGVLVTALVRAVVRLHRRRTGRRNGSHNRGHHQPGPDRRRREQVPAMTAPDPIEVGE